MKKQFLGLALLALANSAMAQDAKHPTHKRTA